MLANPIQSCNKRRSLTAQVSIYSDRLTYDTRVDKCTATYTKIIYPRATVRMRMMDELSVFTSKFILSMPAGSVVILRRRYKQDQTRRSARLLLTTIVLLFAN